MSAKVMKSKFFPHSSSVVRRPCRNYLRTFWADSFQISAAASPGQYPWAFFCILEEKMHFPSFHIFFFFSFSLTWHPMATKTSKTLLLPQITFEYFLIFLPCGPHKSTGFDFWNCEFWFLQFFFICVNMGPKEKLKTSKCYSSHKSLLNFSKFLPNFHLSGSHKSVALDFWKCKFTIFNDFFRNSLNFTIVPYG